jgi:hypothetical protein
MLSKAEKRLANADEKIAALDKGLSIAEARAAFADVKRHYEIVTGGL